MSKRKETLEIESTLHYMCQKRRIYGCEEVTIGFYNREERPSYSSFGSGFGGGHSSGGGFSGGW